MSLVEKPPDWWKNKATHTPKFLDKIYLPEIKSFVQKANELYLHWEKLKYLPMPKGFTPEIMWGYVKTARFTQMKDGEIKTQNGDHFEYWTPDVVLKELHYIDQNATGQILVDDARAVDSDRERYILNSLMEEAIASSILEGAATTRKHAKEMLREGRKPVSRGEVMIQNNYATMQEITRRTKDELSIEFLCELQAMITKNTLDDPTASGRLRNKSEEIHVIDEVKQEILYTPPPADTLRERIALMCDFANNESPEIFMHPVVKGIILHFWLAYEHPFVDGNGRTARALFYWYLLKHRYWLIEYLPISRIILKAPSQYKMAFLYSEHDDNDLTYFITFNLRALRLAIDDLKKYVARKQQESLEAKNLVRRMPGLNHRQQELIQHAVHHTGMSYSIRQHMNIHGIVYQTARMDLLQLVKKKIFTMGKIGRTMWFYPAADLAKKMKSEVNPRPRTRNKRTR